eukprot:COSAG02_NODE_6458_length_3558_cov_2.844753_3_plen_57_part_00
MPGVTAGNGKMAVIPYIDLSWIHHSFPFLVGSLQPSFSLLRDALQATVVPQTCSRK